MTSKARTLSDLMARLVGSTICYPKDVGPSFTLERALAGIASVGLEKVELFSIRSYCEHVSLDDVSDDAADALRELLGRYSLVPTVLNIATSLDTEPGVTDFERAAELAERLDVKLIVANVESVSDDATSTAFFERVPRLLAAAERHDVVLALEIHGGLVSTLTDGAELVHKIGSERVKIAYDIANVVKYGRILPEDDLRANAGAIKDVIAYVHLKDKADLSDRYDYPAFGEGVINFGAVRNLLGDAEYDGLMAIEVELDGHPASPEIVDGAIGRSIGYLERTWPLGPVAR